MKKYQILQKLFGYQSDDEEANSSDEFHDQDNFVSDGGLEPEREGKPKRKGEGEASRRDALVHHDDLGSSRCCAESPDNEKGKDPAVFSAAVIHDVFGDSDDDEPVENVVWSQTNDRNRPPKYKGNSAEDSRVRNAISDEDETYEYEEECTKPKLKGKGVAPIEVFQIPLRAPPVHPNQMATIKLSNLICIDPKPFDPMTFEEEGIYVTDAFGSKRRVPSSNIIRFKEVRNPDGTISVESNAKFVEWSDGSLQLLIGNEAFDVSEQDAQDIQSHLFLRHGKGIYQSQGRISRKMKFMPSSLSSNSHRSLAAFVDSRHKKVNKVRRYISDEDPESMMEQNEKAETQTSKASKQLNEEKKKVINKYKHKGRKERELTPGFLEDSIDEDDEQDYYEPPSASIMHHFDLDLNTEAAAEKIIMNAKMGPKGKSKESGSNLKKQFIESDEDMPPRRTGTRRHTAIMYDSSDE